MSPRSRKPTSQDETLVYQREVRDLREQRRRIEAGESDASEHTPAKRLTLSQILELILSRSTREHSSVTLTRNAKGETQIEVVVRCGESAEFATVDQANTKAIELFDSLRARYPFTVIEVRDK